ncbi:MAG TPA: response regulator [Isosphaeraceae bacterium]|jgi:chemotaxis protein histidine kinase CheA|nr:response regulator [Isosphaeraceae bacterium]
MMFPADTDALEQFAGRLDHLGRGLDSSQPDALAPAREELGRLQAEAEAWGSLRLAEALQRLSLMIEVWECLAGEDPESAAEVGSFCQRVANDLSQRLRDGGNDEHVAWVVRESAERWGAYLGLLGSDCSMTLETAEEAFAEEPTSDDLPAAMDLNSLLRLLTRDQPTDDLTSDGAEYEPPAIPEPDQELLADGMPQEFLSDDEPVEDPDLGSDGLATRGHWNLDGLDPDEAAAASEWQDTPSAPFLPQESLLEALWAPLKDLEPELREAFLADASDLFERIQTLVLEDLGRAGNHAQTLRELSRCFHTLKGAAGSVGLGELVTRIHELEDRLEEATDGEAAVPVDLLHESLGYLESVLYSLRKPAVPSPLAGLINSQVMDIGLSDLLPPATPKVVEVEPGPSPNWSTTPSSSASDSSVRVPCSRIDELMDLVSELMMRRGVWAAQVETMREFAATARLGRNRLMASIDRLRDIALVREPLTNGSGTTPAAPDEVAGLVRRLAEQGEDLAAMAETARAAADPLADDADALARLSLQLWDALQAVRVVPVRGLFHRLARVAREASRVESRPIEVVLIGEDSGLDRSIQDKAFEPLLHAVRNAVGHGIEPVQDRILAGKPPLGRITLEAHREGYTLVLKVQDDGRGLDNAAIVARARQLGQLAADEEPTPEQLNALVFQPGFTTRARADEISGRGVGMDVIAQEVGRLHGMVALHSLPGVGTTLTIRLPARLALEQAMVVRVGGRALALPLSAIELAQQWVPADQEGEDTVRLRDRRVRLLDARQALGLEAAPLMARPKLLLIRAAGQSLALRVDAIEGPRELVIKPLGALLAGHPVIAGTSLSPTGELILVLDPFGLVRHRLDPSLIVRTAAETPSQLTKVLVVDDALSVRRAARRHLRALGLETEEVGDGVEALRKVRTGAYDLILADLEMPRMDGLELLAELQRSGVSAATPVVIISTRSDSQTINRVLALGARALVAKPIDPDVLARVIAPLLPSTLDNAALRASEPEPGSLILSPAASPQF